MAGFGALGNTMPTVWGSKAPQPVTRPYAATGVAPEWIDGWGSGLPATQSAAEPLASGAVAPAMSAPMSMMGGYGGGGTLDGSRSMPASSVVDPMQSATRWASDWNNRYDEETARAAEGRAAGIVSTVPSQISSLTRPLGTQNPDNNQWYYTDANGNQQISPNPVYGRDDLLPGGVSVDDKGFLSINESMLPFGKSAQDVMQELSDRSLHPEQAWKQTMDFTPHYASLMEERDRMLPIMEQQHTAQQAYDSMLGWNQLNGIVSPFYGDPNFGQVNGNFGQDQMRGVESPAGFDASLLGYDGGATGLNAPALPVIDQYNGWGAPTGIGTTTPARQRPRQYGLF